MKCEVTVINTQTVHLVAAERLMKDCIAQTPTDPKTLGNLFTHLQKVIPHKGFYISKNFFISSTLKKQSHDSNILSHTH